MAKGKTFGAPKGVLRLALLVCLAPFSSAHAQSHDLVFEEVVLPGGSLGNNVTSIVQDRRGFMWFGTWAGLHRYDGYGFKTYTSAGPDSLSLPARWVESLAVDRDNTVWIGTYGGGLVRLDPDTETFRAYHRDSSDPHSLPTDSITSIVADRSGRIWVGGLHGGLARYEPSSDSFTRFVHDPNDSASLSDDQIRAIYEDRSGILWIGTNSIYDPPDGPGGLNRFDPRTETFTRYMAEADDPTKLINRHVKAMLEDSQGRFWVGTFGDGLHRLDRESGRFTRLPFDPGDASSPSVPTPVGDPFAGISFIDEDRAGRLWIGSISLGVGVLDGGTIQAIRGTGSDLIRSGWCFYESRDGTIWISTLNGLYRITPASANLPLHVVSRPERPTGRLDGEVLSLFKDSRSLVWVGTGRGLLTIEPNGDFRSRHRAWVWDMEEDAGGRLWMLGQTDTGMVLLGYDPNSNSFHERELGGTPRGEIGTALRVELDRDGGMWIGGDGLWYLTPEALECILTDGPDCRIERLDVVPEGTDRSNSVTSLGIDAEGRIMVGTLAGLFRMNPVDRGFDRVGASASNPATLSDSAITALHTDRTGRIWIGTLGGVYLVVEDEDSEVGFTQFSASNSGLGADVVLQIFEDGAGNLWLHGGNVITRFNPQENTFKTYPVTFGHSASTVDFVIGAGSRSADGEIFFGGSEGFTRFYPDRLNSSSAPPEVTLTDFRIANKRVVPGSGGPLRTPIWKAATITLAHDQNDFSFDFVGFHYAVPEGISYQYMLVNWDEDWREAGSMRSASYSGLPPGRYVFRLKAANVDGVWSDETSVQLAILPPWWRTVWAYIAYGLCFVAGVAGVDRLQRRRVIRRERERSRERELEQAREIERAYRDLKTTQQQLVQSEKMASLGQLTAGIAHEIKNPLNFINNFAGLTAELADELEETIRGRIGEGAAEFEEILQDLRTNASKIQEHGQRADGIVKSMLLHSRGNAGERQETNLNALLEEYANLAYHGMRAQNSNLNVEIVRELDTSVGKVPLVPQDIGRVFVNLLSNAFYAVHERAETEGEAYSPRVTVGTRRENGTVEIRIADNGMGISEDKRARIFEPFFTTKPTGSGTGLGLSMSYDIITAGHGGTIEVESEEGQGATFVLRLPG